MLITGGCKKDKSIPFVDCSTPTNDQSLGRQLIIGQWDWTYETYFNRVTRKYETITPLTEGYTRSIVFEKNSTAVMYRNGQQEINLTYEISGLDKVTGISGDNKITTLIFYNQQTGERTDFAPVRICTDSLYLNYDFYSDVKGREVWTRKN